MGLSYLDFVKQLFIERQPCARKCHIRIGMEAWDVPL